MEKTKCIKCENTSFEMIPEFVANSKQKVHFIRCTHCKSALGVLDYYDSVYFIKKLAEKLNVDIDS